MANAPQEAVDWFIGKARTATGYRNNLFEKNPGRNRSYPASGRMYFFAYDPKLKQELPMYDKFPLVFPIEPKKGGFLGLNVHYLSVSQRSALLGSLMKFANNRVMDNTTKLNLDYEMMTRVASMASLVKPCVKRYLYGHIRSPFVEILANEWSKVIELPVDLFITKK